MELAVAQLSDLIQVVRSFELLDFLFHFFDLLTDFSELTDRVFLGLPACLERLEIAVFLGQFFFNRLQPCLAARIRFLFQRFPFDLQLKHLARDFVQLGRQAVDLRSKACGRLVDQVDGLIRQEPVTDIAVR